MPIFVAACVLAIVWAVVALILGLAWTLTGNQPVGVGPIQP